MKTNVTLISQWAKRPKKYRLRPDQTMVQIVIQEPKYSQTRHLVIDKSDPILSK